jgi:hypothetical protein
MNCCFFAIELTLFADSLLKLNKMLLQAVEQKRNKTRNGQILLNYSEFLLVVCKNCCFYAMECTLFASMLLKINKILLRLAEQKRNKTRSLQITFNYCAILLIVGARR